MHRVLVLGALVFTGCMTAETITCPDGRFCPQNTVCFTIVSTDRPDEPVCVAQDQLDACSDPATRSCGADGLSRCYGGVCLDGGCGNGRLDTADGEVCDDGNNAAADGCSASCASDERCGNGLIDLVGGEDCDDRNAIDHDGCSSSCRTEVARWIYESELVPAVRTSALMAYDAARDRTVLFGGRESSIALFPYLRDTWEFKGSYWRNAAPAVSPTLRAEAAMAYDAARGQIVLFGGNTAAVPTNDTWVWDGKIWRRIMTPSAPTPRALHAMAYDSRLKRIVIFGGAGAPARMDDTWSWDGSTWTLIDVVGARPPARARHAMTYDPVRDVIVMFGGDAGSVFSDTWELRDSTWTMRTPNASPAARVDHVMAFDQINRRPVLVGGCPSTTCGTSNTDTWAWDGTTWERIDTTLPATMDAPAMAPSTGGTLLLLGKSSDTYRWNGSSWQQTAPNPSSGPFTSRAEHTGAVDIANRRILVHGGLFNNSNVDETWIWNGIWTRIGSTPTPPGPRYQAGMAYDTTRKVFVMFGGKLLPTGVVTDPYARGTWTYGTGPAWQQVTGIDPGIRFGAPLVNDPARENVVMFGGRNADAPTSANDETWTWNGTWMLRQPATKPPARSGACAAYDPIRQRVVVFGGLGANGVTTFLNDVWEWNGTTWMDKSVAFAPPSRDGCSLAWDAARQRMILMGGGAGNAIFDDVWEWDGTAWSELDVVPPLGPRDNTLAVSDPNGAGIVTIGVSAQATTMQHLRWDGPTVEEACTTTDADRDGLVSAADPDCWSVLKPLCPPGVTLVSTCGPSAPGCGDGTCDAPRESCRTCADDCMCTAYCGDLTCDATETAMTCPGDCP